MESKTMKKVILSAVVVCCAGMGFFWQSQGKSETSSDLLFENVEALAVEENWENGSDCQGSGSVVCPYTDDVETLIYEADCFFVADDVSAGSLPGIR